MDRRGLIDTAWNQGHGVGNVLGMHYTPVVVRDLTPKGLELAQSYARAVKADYDEAVRQSFIDGFTLAWQEALEERGLWF